MKLGPTLKFMRVKVYSCTGCTVLQRMKKERTGPVFWRCDNEKITRKRLNTILYHYPKTPDWCPELKKGGINETKT